MICIPVTQAEFSPLAAAQYARYTVHSSSKRRVSFRPKTLRVKSWYSPSASFLDIAPTNNRLTAEQPLPVQLTFTVPQKENISHIDFFYRVKLSDCDTVDSRYKEH